MADGVLRETRRGLCEDCDRYHHPATPCERIAELVMKDNREDEGE